MSDNYDTLLLGVNTLHCSSSLYEVLLPMDSGWCGIFLSHDYDATLSGHALVYISGSIFYQFYVVESWNLDGRKSHVH